MKSLYKILSFLVLVTVGTQANALSIAAPVPQNQCNNFVTDGSGWYEPTPSDPTWTPDAPGWVGPVDCFTDPGNDEAEFISNYTGEDVTLSYKSDYDNGEEDGSFLGHYSTTYPDGGTSSEPSAATITFDGTDSITCGDCWLAVKDGNQDPIWYLYDLQSLGWNGTDDIVLTGFWPEQGAISHVAIYSADTPVPAPTPLIVMAIGLLGMLGMRRMKKAI